MLLRFLATTFIFFLFFLGGDLLGCVEVPVCGCWRGPAMWRFGVWRFDGLCGRAGVWGSGGGQLCGICFYRVESTTLFYVAQSSVSSSVLVTANSD
jgi:hypothetical protein